MGSEKLKNKEPQTLPEPVVSEPFAYWTQKINFTDKRKHDFRKEFSYSFTDENFGEIRSRSQEMDWKLPSTVSKALLGCCLGGWAAVEPFLQWFCSSVSALSSHSISTKCCSACIRGNERARSQSRNSRPQTFLALEVTDQDRIKDCTTYSQGQDPEL